MKTITLTNEQYQALLNGESVTIEPPKPKVEKWQPKGGEWFVAGEGSIPKQQSYKKFANFGTEYPTKEAAEKARDAMRTHNRLLAWLAENDDGWVADWSDDEQGKYYIYLESNPKEKASYGFNANWYCRNLVTVYMSEQNAIKLCELLNDGVVEL